MKDKGTVIKDFWRAPYLSLVSPWKVVVVPAAIIFLVLCLLQPFGIARIGSGKLWVTVGAAGISAVASAPFIVRCHRAFLVNLHQVVKVDGNSQGYRLRLEGCTEEVPVSRGYAKCVKALIESD